MSEIDFADIEKVVLERLESTVETKDGLVHLIGKTSARAATLALHEYHKRLLKRSNALGEADD